MSAIFVYVAYDPNDTAEKDELLIHLNAVRDLTAWTDDQIEAGADRRAALLEAINRAEIALLLVTANFLASKPIRDEVLPRLLERQRCQELWLLPVIAKSCVWQAVDWLAELDVRPHSRRPVWSDGGSHAAEDLSEIVAEIVARVRGQPSPQPRLEPPTAPLSSTPPTAGRQIGGLALSNIQDSPITIGNMSATVQASGDVVAGDKQEIHHHYYGPSPAPATAEKARRPFEPALVEIPAGPFIMGTDEGQPYEKPAHTIILPAYQIGLYPVTNWEFAAFIEATGKVVPSLGWPGQRPAPKQAELPVTGVSWYLALAYCAWLSEQTGRAYALPTEAEWEKAARGTDGRRYPWGNDWQAERANADPARLTPVNRYPVQSIYGCYDLVGNGREWTCSLWGSQPHQPEARFGYPQTADQSDLAWDLEHPRHNLAANSQMRRVYRGGTGLAPDQPRCSLRQANLPETKRDLNRHGLRVVRREAKR